MSLKQAEAALDKILENPNFVTENSKSDLSLQYACLIRPSPPVLDIKSHVSLCQKGKAHMNGQCVLRNTDPANVLNGDYYDYREIGKTIQVVSSFDICEEASSTDETCDGFSDCSSLQNFLNASLAVNPDTCITVEPSTLCAAPRNGLEFLHVGGNIHDGFIPLDPKKYKTELCRSYHVHGYCKYGIRCNYAHGIGQLKISFRHGKYKTRNCQSYHETGICRYGARCSFIHDPEEGILKCPITDREILEALHYFPLEQRSVANITWKVVDGSFCPSELYFFANRQPLPWSSNNKNQSYSTILDLDVEQSSRNSDKERTPVLNSIKSDASALSSDAESTHSEKKEDNGKCLTVGVAEPLSDNKNICHTEDKLEVSPEPCVVQCPPKATNYEKSYSERLSEGIDGRVEEIGCSKTVVRYCPEEHSQTYERRNSSAKTSFSLNDFLRCLKTKEGEQHLAPWPPEPQKVSKEPEVPIKPKKVPGKVELVCKARDTTKYKTELCRSYQYNKYCEYGDTCLYAHGQLDLRSYPKHPMYRTKKCYSFHYKGFCLYGSRCQFLHDLSF